jgi:hypothetical protein
MGDCTKSIIDIALEKSGEKKLAHYDKYVRHIENAKIDNRFDVPYFAGYNWANTKIYVDKDAPEIIHICGKEFNLHQSLAMHEYVEKCHIDKGYTYAAAHEIATKYERTFVKEQGILWKDYNAVVGKLMHANWISKLESVPHDLDMTPMEYSRDLETLAKIRKLLVKK